MKSQKGFANIVLIAAILILIGLGGYFAWSKKSNNAKTTEPMANIDTSDWKIYKNSEYGIELNYPPTWKIQEKVTGFGFWINPPDFKMPANGTVNPYFAFDRTAHMYLGDEKPIVKMFGTRMGYVYVKDRSVYFPEENVAGGYFIKIYTRAEINEPNQILSTFKFTD